MKNRFFSPFFSLLFPLYFLLESQLIWAEDPQILQITERRVNTPSCFGLGLQFYSSVDFLEKEKFCFKLSYEYLSIERSKTFCDKDLPYNPLFYVQDPSILGGDIYSLNICINENYVSIDDSLYPENFDNVSELSLDISYNDEVLEESISIIQEQEYFLGNHEFMGNFKLLSGFKKVRVQDDLASLPRLLFREGSATTIDNELSESDAKDLFSYFIIDITNAGETSFKSESTSFDNTTASQTSFYPLNSRTLNLDNLTKLEYDAWFSYLPTKLEAISQDQCFFVLPGSGHRVGDNYECIRCNFNDDNNTIASHNKSYLIQASSFTSDNLSSGSNDNLSIVKRNFALNRNDGANEFVGLNNTHYYVIFSLFGRDNETDRNMIRYNLDNGTASNVAVGTGSIDSRFMCRTFKPRKDYTFLEYLNGKDQSDTKLGDPRCFIASAAYGSSLAAELDNFRWFRDRFLLTHSFGKKFVQFYYEQSPAFAEFIAESNFLKFLTRMILWPLALFLSFIKLAMSSLFFFILFSGSALILLYCFFKLRRKNRCKAILRSYKS